MTGKPIVAATDGSGESLRAVEWAAREAVLRGAPLRLVSAAALPRVIGHRPDPDTVGFIHAERDRALAASAARAAELAPGLMIDTDPIEGEPAQAVTESGSGALMLVVGSRGIGGFTALVLGSVSRHAAARATCPVVVIRDEGAVSHQLIGVGIGDLDDCADSLTFAFEEAALRGAGLAAIHAWHTPQTEISRAGDPFPPPGLHAVAADAARQLAGLLEGWRQKYPDVPVTQDVTHGHPGRALIGLSTRADLVVIGRHSAHLHDPGSVRHAVLNHAHGPIAVIPSAA